MILIDSNSLISFFQSEADKAAATGFPVLAAENQCSADTFRDFAGKLHFYPHATANVYFYSPLPALPAVCQETRENTWFAFDTCTCPDAWFCAHWYNVHAMCAILRPVDRDGLTAID